MSDNKTNKNVINMKKQIVYDFVKSINNHDVDRIYELMNDDFRFIDAYGNVETGKDHMKESWMGYFRWFPDYEIEIIDIVSDGDTFVILGFASGTYQNIKSANNENYWRLPAAWRVVVLENKIKDWQVYCDSKIPFDIVFPYISTGHLRVFYGKGSQIQQSYHSQHLGHLHSDAKVNMDTY